MNIVNFIFKAEGRIGRNVCEYNNENEDSSPNILSENKLSRFLAGI